LLSFAFQPRDVERRAQSDEITADERTELENYLQVSNLLLIMQSQARQFLTSTS
jgi:hypothetical protein